MRIEPRRDFLKTLLGTTLLAGASVRTAYSQESDDDRYRPTPDGVIATQSRLYGPAGICFDSNGNLYVVDQLHKRIRRIHSKTRVITTIAGTGERGLTGDGSLAIRATLDFPTRVFVDRQSDLFFTEYIKDRVRQVDSKSGVISTVAGNGIPRWEDRSREGDLATKRSFDRPGGIGSDAQGNLIVCDSTRILRIDKVTQRMTTLSEEYLKTGGYPFPSDLVVDGDDNIYFAEANTGRIRVLRRNNTTQTIYTKRTDGTISNPVVDTNGILFFIESNLVFKIELASKRVSLFAGKPRTRSAENFSGDGGLATEAGMDNPSGLALDAQGNLYISDWIANRIRRIDRRTRIIETVAGNGEPKHPRRPLL